MTDNRTTELLPCPFCGGEPEIRERKVHHTDWFGKDYRLMYRVRCTKCGAAIGGYSPVLFHRDSNGIEHGAGVDWNTRTPEQAIADELNARGERTCKSTTDDNAWCFACSECGKSFPRSKLHLAHNHGEINYCPHCGAKVVDA